VKWLLAAFVAGVVLMMAFEHVVTRVFGLLCLFGFIVGGVFLIADPVALGKEEEATPDEPRTRG
jgi:hypothetical protein